MGLARQSELVKVVLLFKGTETKGKIEKLPLKEFLKNRASVVFIKPARYQSSQVVGTCLNCIKIARKKLLDVLYSKRLEFTECGIVE